MAGRIKADVIDEVKQHVHIEDVVGDYVALKPAGIGSLKGLCPFHEEKTPSFHVRVQLGYFHCFGCGESGDVISFVEKIEHVSFAEAVEFLARKAGIDVQYEESYRSDKHHKARNEVKRARLIDAHRVAEEFYMNQLKSDEAQAGRELLAQRGFSEQALQQFRVGYSPRSWDACLQLLRKHGFTEKEIAASGLAASGQRGLYDRFRGRLMWPIHSTTGDPIGFGARKIDDSQEGPKYLNTPETMIYKKSDVLYGIDMAKKSIAREHKVVIVEGYTDVMAAHIAGVPQAVATCGTAFGHTHATIVRRLIGDSASPAAGVILHTGRGFGGEVIFTFDGDSAGQKAALRVFHEDQSFGAQTFVAILPDGMDPCELRMKYGDAAVREIIAKRQPLFAFVVKSLLKDLPLNTAEGRAAGLRYTAPVVASIRDRVLRGEYVRLLTGWLGMDEHIVRSAVLQAERTIRQQPARLGQAGAISSRQASALSSRMDRVDAASELNTDSNGHRSGRGGHADAQRTAPVLKERSHIKDPVERTERAALDIIMQFPKLAVVANAQQLPASSFAVPVHRTIFDAVRAVGGVYAAQEQMDKLEAQGVDAQQAESRGTQWFVDQVAAQLDPSVRSAVFQLSVEPLEEDQAEDMWRYVRGVMMALIRQGYTRQIADVRSHMQRVGADSPQQAVLFERLMQLEAHRRNFDEIES